MGYNYNRRRTPYNRRKKHNHLPSSYEDTHNYPASYNSSNSITYSEQTTNIDSGDTHNSYSYSNSVSINIHVGDKYYDDDDYYSSDVPTADECYERILEKRKRNGGNWL